MASVDIPGNRNSHLAGRANPSNRVPLCRTSQSSPGRSPGYAIPQGISSPFQGAPEEKDVTRAKSSHKSLLKAHGFSRAVQSPEKRGLLPLRGRGLIALNSLSSICELTPSNSFIVGALLAWSVILTICGDQSFFCGSGYLHRSRCRRDSGDSLPRQEAPPGRTTGSPRGWIHRRGGAVKRNDFSAG